MHQPTEKSRERPWRVCGAEVAVVAAAIMAVPIELSHNTELTHEQPAFDAAVDGVLPFQLALLGPPPCSTGLP